jgi:homoserine dehydrogenase
MFDNIATARNSVRHAPVDAHRIDLILIGARGKVGAAFRGMLTRQQPALLAETNLDLRLLAGFDRRGFAFDAHGLVPNALDARMVGREDADIDRMLSFVKSRNGVRAIVIDCTASDEIADLYPRLLGDGIGVVAANKRANARSLAFYHGLQRTARDMGAPYRYETTVGSAIPLLGPLRDLRLRGERVLSLQGVLSGSLSYILHRMHEGCAFSSAVGEARDLGYTEPDVMEDLRAIDLSRKLLVLAREAGFGMEENALEVELLGDLQIDADDVIPALQVLDDGWRVRIAEALARGERWVAIAEAAPEKARISLRSMPAHSAFAQLAPGQNLIEIKTELQDRMPLLVSGAGAGVEITAAGVLSDAVTAAMHWPSRC